MRPHLPNFFVLLSLFGLILWVAFEPNALFYYYDEAFWQYMGFIWKSHGLAPYQYSHSLNSPGMYFIFYLSNAWLGANFWFPRFLSAISILATAFTILKISRLIGLEKWSVLSILIFGFTILWRSTGGQFLTESESFIILFNTTGAYFLMKLLAEERLKYAMWCGLALGLSVMTKQVAYVFALCALVFLMQASFKVVRKQTVLWTWILGFVFIHIMAAFPLLLSGIGMKTYLTYLYIVPLQAGGMGPLDLTLSDRLGIIVSKLFETKLLLFYPFLIFFFFKAKHHLHNALYRCLCCWFFADTLSVLISSSLSWHHVRVMVPVWSVIAVWSIANLIFHWPDRIRLMVVGGIVILWFPASTLFIKRDTSRELSEKELGLWLKQHSNESDYVHIVGPGAIALAYAERRTPTRFFSFLRLRPDDEKLLKDELEEQLPDLLVIPVNKERINTSPSLLKMSEALADTHYRLLDLRFGYEIFSVKRAGIQLTP